MLTAKQLSLIDIKSYDVESKSIELIKYFEPLALQHDPRGYCVAMSWGKDSMANLKLFIKAGVKFFIQWNITGIDPPELIYFGRRQAYELELKGYKVIPIHPEKSMIQMIVDHCTPPTALMRYCCDELKEKRPEINKNCIHSFGVRWDESPSRSNGREAMEVISKNKENIRLFNDNGENRKQFEVCMAKGVKALNPIISWTTEQIWDYHKAERITYCKLYDCGFDRLGCVGCPLANKPNREFEFKMFPEFKKYYMLAFEKMVVERKRRKVDEKRIAKGKKPMPFDTAKNVWNWWIERKSLPAFNPNQMYLEPDD
ncbi:phosphoadenosine phosphosulfate reductase [Ruminiclostridium papyrosolvens DSM 2782]|uniref:Phosphoadenosine phosphosulfate reductase n=1 Tax=Ruminiclostridium papyrosolvens DSM 2782 TaxID=588581 RepID=F1TEE3_9FIRM|nr:phosphoadenosine phosphosulfate reductase family protein [Ruminiclostridium papyrosolvens]EGD47109.1 phosphoadenosine phosphosulfate reductase [Ruminiclostridium papyrosolvens DSM 2782]WES36052.1 phosphoadenosine phosphosulfate reductase family protein [Ruminiclostridium papyrosolvens DSM 2782]WES36150.1 phosphoadenosine phosphosulfate reductase family protein [Ruminiclostridium papyrosolvens DSM 2782]